MVAATVRSVPAPFGGGRENRYLLEPQNSFLVKRLLICWDRKKTHRKQKKVRMAGAFPFSLTLWGGGGDFRKRVLVASVSFFYSISSHRRFVPKKILTLVPTAIVADSVSSCCVCFYIAHAQFNYIGILFPGPPQGEGLGKKRRPGNPEQPQSGASRAPSPGLWLMAARADGPRALATHPLPSSSLCLSLPV